MNIFNTKTPLWLRLSLLLFVLISELSSADNIPAYDLNDDTQLFSISSSHWEDTSLIATPTEAKAQLVNGALIKSHFSIPMTKASHWFAFTLTNVTDHALAKSVYLKQAYPEIVNLHYQHQGKWVSDANGTDIALNKRNVNNILPVFNINLDANESRTFYLEIHSKIKILELNFHVDALKYSHSIGDLHSVLVTLFIGSGILVSLINSLMYLSFKDKSYLYFSAYCFSFVAATFAMNSFDLFFEFQLQDRRFLLLFYHSMIFFLSLFVSEVLQDRKDMPWIRMLLRASRGLVLTIAVLTLYDGNYFSYTLGSTPNQAEASAHHQ